MQVTLFLSGDVMLGRGLDQVMPHPGEPQLREYYVRDARDYVSLAVAKNGPIPVPIDFSYVWGDALVELERIRPDFRIVNLETSVTASNDFWPEKGIHYRMHPGNIACLTEAGIDCTVLANNHVLDFGYQGLSETLATLAVAGIKTTGAGVNIERASEPAVLERDEKRVVVYSYAHGSSGVTPDWWAEKNKAGVNFLPDFSEVTVGRIKEVIAGRKRPGDIVVFSVHWGGNWGYAVEEAHRRFAHRVIDEAGVDVIHGHSSHHAKAAELYKGKLILYGCGDFIDDYEGISGYEEFRNDLKLMYFLELNPGDGALVSLQMVPVQTKRFRLHHAVKADAQWLFQVLKREGERFGTKIELTGQNVLHVAC